MHVFGMHVLFCLHDMSLSCKFLFFLFPAIIVLNREVKVEDENVAVALCLIIIASAALRIRCDRRRPRQWALAWIYRSRHFGAHHASMKELTSEDPHSFRNFTRLDKQDFDKLLTKVTPFIQKQDTNMRESITPAERLSLPLSYLAFFCICWHFCFFPFFLIIRKIFGT